MLLALIELILSWAVVIIDVVAVLIGLLLGMTLSSMSAFTSDDEVRYGDTGVSLSFLKIVKGGFFFELSLILFGIAGKVNGIAS